MVGHGSDLDTCFSIQNFAFVHERGLDAGVQLGTNYSNWVTCLPESHQFFHMKRGHPLSQFEN